MYSFLISTQGRWGQVKSRQVEAVFMPTQFLMVRAWVGCGLCHSQGHWDHLISPKNNLRRTTIMQTI